MSALDREARGERYLDALEGLYDLLAGRVPELQVQPAQLGQLIGILNDEARAVVPVEKFGPRGFNDNQGGDP